MKIRPEIEVFDDAEKCEDQLTSGICSYPVVKNKKSYCSLYLEYIESKVGIILKCDQCKADYLKAKRKEPTDQIFIGPYRFDCLKSRFSIAC